MVRVDGIDTETGKNRPRQLGTYPSQRSVLTAARSISVQERMADPGHRQLARVSLCRVALRCDAESAE
jgi:hypothetical protein